MVAEALSVSTDVALVPPDVERDAAVAVTWLQGDQGRQTLQAMGVLDSDIHDATLEEERRRSQTIINDPNEIAWMIQLNGQTVGIVEVALAPTAYLQAPAVHIMIGDPRARGQGIGRDVFRAVCRWLREEQHNPTIYTRVRTDNAISRHMLETVGFGVDGTVYADADGMQWQNMKSTGPKSVDSS